MPESKSVFLDFQESAEKVEHLGGSGARLRNEPSLSVP
jgi:hypothetical protein